MPINRKALMRYKVIDPMLRHGKEATLDEVASLSIAIQKMSQHITPEVERKTDEVLDRWFAEYTEYVEVEKS